MLLNLLVNLLELSSVLEDVPGVLVLEDVPGELVLEDVPAVLVLEGVPGVVVLEDVHGVVVLEDVSAVLGEVGLEVLVDLLLCYHVKVGFITG